VTFLYAEAAEIAVYMQWHENATIFFVNPDKETRNNFSDLVSDFLHQSIYAPGIGVMKPLKLLTDKKTLIECENGARLFIPAFSPYIMRGMAVSRAYLPKHAKNEKILDEIISSCFSYSSYGYTLIRY
jgi:hypothetical protein